MTDTGQDRPTEKRATVLGSLALVLHSHLPYLRQADHHLHGEEALDEIIAETYLPLVNTLLDLRAEGVPFRLTIGITPILAEQLADADVLVHLENWLLEKTSQAEDDVRRFEEMERHPGAPSQAGHFLYLARFYADWYRRLLESLRDRLNRDLIGAFRLLQDDGLVEILTSAATYAYLPLMERDSTIYAQLKTGVTSYLRYFGRLPRGVWLPECGYRPAVRGSGSGPKGRAGLESFLAELNLRYTFADTRSIARGRAAGQGEGTAGPHHRPLYNGARPFPQEKAAFGDIFLHPYYIQGSNVAVYGRDEHVGRQVWSSTAGYPGDFAYRDPHRREERSGLPYWRITGEGLSPEQKDLYDPYHAFHRAQEHAAHFCEVVRGRLRSYRESHGRSGIVVAVGETEILGRWWFEGIRWLKEVLTLLSRCDDVVLSTTGEYLAMRPPEGAILLAEGSWSREGDHSAWLNPTTEWMWPSIHEAERHMEELVARFPDAEGERLEVLKQAARELLLLESSDWPLLMATGRAEYAAERFQTHRTRFHRLASLAEREALDEEGRRFLLECQHLDNPFLNMDYRAFAAREV